MIVVSVVSGADRELIVQFLRSIETGENELRIIATVNGPDEALARDIDALATTVVMNRERRGFAANHNSAMAMAPDADFYLIANDDVIVERGAVDELVRFANEAGNERVAVISPQLLDPDGSIQPSTYSFPSGARMLLSVSGLRSSAVVSGALHVLARLVPKYRAGGSKYWAHDGVRTVDTVRGAFVLVRAAAVRDVGPMDEASLAGGEETEWHKRMADRGWSVAFDPKARVVHFGGQTVRADDRIQLEYLRGWLHYFSKHTPGWRFSATKAGAVLVFAGRWCVATSRDRRRLASNAIRIAMSAR